MIQVLLYLLPSTTHDLAHEGPPKGDDRNRPHRQSPHVIVVHELRPANQLYKRVREGRLKVSEEVKVFQYVPRHPHRAAWPGVCHGGHEGIHQRCVRRAVLHQTWTHVHVEGLHRAKGREGHRRKTCVSEEGPALRVVLHQAHFDGLDSHAVPRRLRPDVVQDEPLPVLLLQYRPRL